MKKENRRDFIKKTGAVAAGITLGGTSISAKSYRRIMSQDGNPGYNLYIGVNIS